MLRRSDFIAARYAFSLVFANFGIAIAARMPMMTTTIKSSIRVKPFLLRDMGTPAAVGWKSEGSYCAALSVRRRRTMAGATPRKVFANREIRCRQAPFYVEKSHLGPGYGPISASMIERRNPGAEALSAPGCKKPGISPGLFYIRRATSAGARHSSGAGNN